MREILKCRKRRRSKYENAKIVVKVDIMLKHAQICRKSKSKLTKNEDPYNKKDD